MKKVLDTRRSPLCSLQVADFYRFWEGQQEAWDGPALLVWSDGKHVGACLDRNGLRPARFMTLKDGTVLMMSETGVVPVDESQVRSIVPPVFLPPPPSSPDS